MLKQKEYYMANIVNNKIATYLYVKHESYENSGIKDLALDLSESGNLKVVRNTWLNYFVLIFKNFVSLGSRNATILNLAKGAFEISDCSSLKDLQSRELSKDSIPEISNATAQTFADMLYNGPRDDYGRGSIEMPSGKKIEYKLYKHPLVDVKLIPAEAVKGILMPAPLAERVNLLLEGNAIEFRSGSLVDQFGEVTIQK